MRTVPVIAAVAVLALAPACGAEDVFTTGEEAPTQEPEQDTETQPSPGRPDPPPPPDPRSPSPEPTEPAESPEDTEEDEPLPQASFVALDEVHDFGDGFVIALSSVQRRVEESNQESRVPVETEESPQSPEDSSPEEDPSPEDDASPGNGDATDDPSPENGTQEEPSPEESPKTPEEEESPEGDPSPETPSPEEVPPETLDDSPSPKDSPSAEDSPSPEESPTDEPSPEEGRDYFAWNVQITNGTEETVHTGTIRESCHVGDPLRESSGPMLGESLAPPDNLEPGESAIWYVDCWAEEDDTQLQWTVEFFDEDDTPLYPPVTFSGTVD